MSCIQHATSVATQRRAIQSFFIRGPLVPPQATSGEVIDERVLGAARLTEA